MEYLNSSNKNRVKRKKLNLAEKGKGVLKFR